MDSSFAARRNDEALQVYNVKAFGTEFPKKHVVRKRAFQRTSVGDEVQTVSERKLVQMGLHALSQ
jgi:predicted ATPase